MATMLRAEEHEFLRDNHEALMEKYAGKWLVLEGQEVVTADEDPLKAISRARQDPRVVVPFVVYIAGRDEPPFIG